MHSNAKDEQLKLRTSSRALVAGMAIAAALTMSACSSDDNKADSTSTKATATSSAASATQDPNLPPIPTAAELQRAFDPAVPLAEKIDMVQGAEQDPELINRVADAAKAAGIVVTVTNVTDLGSGQLNADATFLVNGQSNPAVVPFIAENGKWKVQKGWACQIVTTAQLQSPACV